MAVFCGICHINQSIVSVLHGVRVWGGPSICLFVLTLGWLLPSATFYLYKMNLYAAVPRLFLSAFIVKTVLLGPYLGMVCISWECFLLLVSIVNSVVIIIVYHCWIFMQYVKKLAWSEFRQSFLPELDKINTIKELLSVKFGVMSLSLFDAEQLNCMLDALCTE